MVPVARPLVWDSYNLEIRREPKERAIRDVKPTAILTSLGETKLDNRPISQHISDFHKVLFLNTGHLYAYVNVEFVLLPHIFRD